MIDSTIVRAHRSAAGHEKRGTSEESKEQQYIGRSKGGLTTKIHALCDALGRPTDLMLTQGQASDLAGFDELSKKIKAAIVIGDKGYDADARVREVLQKAGRTAVIPLRSNRKNPAAYAYDRELYKKRHKIENFFSRLKDFRSIATWFEKTARNFLAGVHLAAAMTWLNGD